MRRYEKYWDTNQGQEGNYKNVIKRWERIFSEEGAEGLMKERRGRACKASGSNKGRPPKLDKKVEEDLLAENQRLRMEIEYLKNGVPWFLRTSKRTGKGVHNCRTKAKVSAERFVGAFRDSKKHILLLAIPICMC